MKRIGCSVSVVGRHYWPDASNHRSYLGIPHEHLFNVDVEIEVVHAERNVEFHDLRSLVLRILGDAYSSEDNVMDFGTSSCETIAEVILQALVNNSALPIGYKQVKVSEDGVCWATCNNEKANEN